MSLSVKHLYELGVSLSVKNLYVSCGFRCLLNICMRVVCAVVC